MIFIHTWQLIVLDILSTVGVGCGAAALCDHFTRPRYY